MQLCKLMAPKHSRGRSGATCEVSELHEISDYANQPGRSPGLAGWLTHYPSLTRFATWQTNGTKALPGSVRVHMQSFGAARNLTMLNSPFAN